MKYTILLSFLLIGTWSFSQTWSDDVAEIFYAKCTQCHHQGGVGPFPLITFAEASSLSGLIYDAVVYENMPPWPPDNSYQEYAHDRSLSDQQKMTILDWIAAGAPEGNPANAPAPPVYNPGSLMGAGDLEVQIPTYMSKATSINDDYVCFALPSSLAGDRVIKAIEIVPGNREIVHHALVYIDPTGSSVTDTVGGNCGSPASAGASLAMGYTPGSSPLTLPASSPLKLGIPMPANSQVILNIHYPAGSFGEYDSTKVIFHFYPQGEPGIREVLTAPILQNWNFTLPPETHTNVSNQYPNSGGLPVNYSILSVFPHMHLLGEEIRAYAVNPGGDTANFIHIPHWDFEWQDFYFFKYIQKAEQGATMYAEGTFDNTSGNPHNPNNPPITVYPGLNTTDEMFLVYAHFMLYQNGDESYNLDSLMNLSTAELLEAENEAWNLQVYPNPFSESVRLFQSGLNPDDPVSVNIYDANGRLIRELRKPAALHQDKLDIVWDGNNDQGSRSEAGIYVISMNVNGRFSHRRIVKH